MPPTASTGPDLNENHGQQGFRELSWLAASMGIVIRHGHLPLSLITL